MTMLDDIRALQAATDGYRAAATAAGIVWPGVPRDAGPPPAHLTRLFDVPRIADQLAWFQAQGWHDDGVLPGGGWVIDWPASSGEAFEQLTLSAGTPFSWRHQIPLFDFELVVYTFVLDPAFEGEIWRYDVNLDAVTSVRAATSLAGLLSAWTEGIESGAVVKRNWLVIDEDAVDPIVFPVPIADYALLEQRQRECGVDPLGAGFDDLLDAVDAARRTL
jgi:hypothetical protein